MTRTVPSGGPPAPRRRDKTRRLQAEDAPRFYEDYKRRNGDMLKQLGREG